MEQLLLDFDRLELEFDPWEWSDGEEEPDQTLPRPRIGEPASVPQILQAGGFPICGYHRQAMTAFLDNALLTFYESAVEEHGAEDAAVLLYRLIRRDPKFRPPWWAICRLRAHRAAVLQSIRRDGDWVPVFSDGYSSD